MITERSDRVWESWRQASEKFDYFVAGLSTALTAFVAGGLPTTKPTTGATILEVASAIVLCVAVGLSIERIRANVTSLAVGHRSLYYNEARGRLVALLAEGGGPQMINESTGEIFPTADAPKKIDAYTRTIEELEPQSARWTKRGERAYTLRDLALLVGLGLYVGARVWKAFA